MSRRALTIALPGAVALIAAGYAAFWWVAATRVVDGVDRWADARRAEGWTVAYERVRASGFPLWIVVDVERPALEAPTADGSATWKGDAVRAKVRPWRFRRVEFDAIGDHEARHIHLPSRRTVASRANGGGGTVLIGPDGRAREITVSMTTIALSTPQAKEEIRLGSLVATATMGDRAGGKQPGVTLDAILADLRLPPTLRAPLGDVVQRLDVAATLKKIVPNAPLPVALASWRDSGGTLKIRNLALNWGPLVLYGKGDIVLDQNLQPAGRMTVRAQGFNETLDAFARGGQIKRRDANVARVVLNFLARPAPGGGARQITVPVSVKDRILTAGPQKLVRLPRINWK